MSKTYIINIYLDGEKIEKTLQTSQKEIKNEPIVKEIKDESDVKEIVKRGRPKKVIKQLMKKKT